MRCRRSAAETLIERGSAVAEFVLVMALLTPLALGIVHLGLVLHVRNTLTAAASEGARAGAPFGATPMDAVDRSRALVAATLADRFARDVSAHVSTVRGVPAIEVVIGAEVPALGLFGPSVQLKVTGHAVKEVIP